MAIKTYGTMAVDWERRIDFDRLRRERLARIKGMLKKSELGSVLCFDMNNVRYITATHIGTWAQDKISRFTLLAQDAEPILWDFGSAARHHQLNCDWLGDRSRAGIPLMRGAMTPEMGRSEEVARKIKRELEALGLHKEPVGVDVVEPPILFALQKEGLTIVDGQQLMSDAREIKTVDEISLLTHSAAMVDAAYFDLYQAMRPGFRENDAVALVAKRLYEMGSEYVEGVNAISAERASPHPHVFSDRMMRPGDPVFYDILHSYMGYRTCYYRCFAIGSASHQLVDAYKRCRDYLDASIELIRPGPLHRGGRLGVAEGHRVRLPGRGSGVRAADGARHRPGHLGEADDQPARLARAPARDQAGHGVRARNLLADEGRHERGPHRGRDRRHRDRPRGDHALPGGRAAGLRRAVRDGERHPADRARDREPAQR